MAEPTSGAVMPAPAEAEAPMAPEGTVQGAADKIMATMLDAETPLKETPSEPEATTEEPQQETEDAPEVTAEEEEAEPIQTLSELAEYYEVDADYFKTLKVPTKIDGVSGEVTIADLVKSFQTQGSVDNRSREIAEMRKSMETEKQNLQSNLNEQLTQASGLVQGLEQKLVQKYENTNWNELRETDPAEFAAKQQEFSQAKQELDQFKYGIQQTVQTQTNERYKQLLHSAIEKLPETIPEWTDEEVATTEKKQMREYLVSQDFTEQELDGVLDEQGNIKQYGLIDPRLIKMARKAMLFDNKMKDVAVTKKKVKKLPKVAKPGKPATASEVSDSQRKAKLAKLRKSGRVEDAASLIYDTMFGT